MHTTRATRATRTLAAVVALGAAAGLVPFHPAPASATGAPHSVAVALVGSAGEPGLVAPQGADTPKLDAAGRFLAFRSYSPFVAADKDGVPDVYVKDLLTGAITEASVTNAGKETVGYSSLVDISADGTRVAFTSNAPDLDSPNDSTSDLYVRDLKAHTTTRVNVNSVGKVMPLANSEIVGALSGNGKVVTFVSGTSAYLRDLVTKKTEQVDVTSSETPANGVSSMPMPNFDGTYVVFDSIASNFGVGDGPDSDLFLRNRLNGSTTLVSENGAHQPANGASYRPVISASARYVAFESNATNYLPIAANMAQQVYEKDLVTGTVVRVSTTPTNTASDGAASVARISEDGRIVTFASSAPDLDPSANGQLAVYVRDLDAGTTKVGLRNVSGQQGNGQGYDSSVSGDGKVVAYASASTNITVGDTNQRDDIFVRTLESEGPHPSLTNLAASVSKDFGAPPAGSQLGKDLLAGRLSVAHAIVKLAHEPAWASDREPVARLYQSFFERLPDAGGLQYWANQHAKGKSLSKIAAQFAQSSEFKTKYGSVGNAAFVELVFQNVLDRQPDAGGLAFWTKKLEAGMSRGDVMTNFSESSEGKRHLAPTVDTALIGLAMLHQMPTKALAAQAVAAAKTAGATEGAALVILDSPAYAALH